MIQYTPEYIWSQKLKSVWWKEELIQNFSAVTSQHQSSISRKWSRLKSGVTISWQFSVSSKETSDLQSNSSEWDHIYGRVAGVLPVLKLRRTAVGWSSSEELPLAISGKFIFKIVELITVASCLFLNIPVSVCILVCWPIRGLQKNLRSWLV